MKDFEYDVQEIGKDLLWLELRNLGEQGWEVVSTVPHYAIDRTMDWIEPISYTVILKREKEDLSDLFK